MPPVTPQHWRRPNAQTSFLQRLVRCDALNARLAPASHARGERNTPRVLAAQKRFVLGVCVGDRKAAVCKVWVRERPWHCPVLRPEEEQALGRALCWKGPFCRPRLENNQLLSAKNLPHVSRGGWLCHAKRWVGVRCSVKSQRERAGGSAVGTTAASPEREAVRPKGCGGPAVLLPEEGYEPEPWARCPANHAWQRAR